MIRPLREIVKVFDWIELGKMEIAGGIGLHSVFNRCSGAKEVCRLVVHLQVHNKSTDTFLIRNAALQG